jgi:hypothetical protein
MLANDTAKIFVWLPMLVLCAAIEQHQKENR